MYVRRCGMKDSSSSTTTTKTKNLGKKFEDEVYKQFKAYPGVSIDRIPDQTMRYKGRKNVSDFIVFRRPRQFYVECKTVHGNRLPFANISQFDALLEKGDIDGVITKRKYRRIKQSIRYKLWIWHNLRWLCKLYGINFEEYEKFYKNKKILRY